MHPKALRANLLVTILLMTFNAPSAAPSLGAAESSGKSGGGLLLVANKGDQTLGIIDPAAGSQIATVAEDGVTGHEVAASRDGTKAFVPIYGNAGVGKPGTDGRLLRVMDLKTWVLLPGVAYGTAPTPDGKWLVMAMPGINQVGILELETLKVARTFVVPKAPQEVLIRPDGMAAYVSCDASHQVAVIDLKNWKVEKLIDAGPGADGLAWARTD
jgi:DNA-binding beta-propeller fold protein YncE